MPPNLAKFGQRWPLVVKFGRPSTNIGRSGPNSGQLGRSFTQGWLLAAGAIVRTLLGNCSATLQGRCLYRDACTPVVLRRKTARRYPIATVAKTQRSRYTAELRRCIPIAPSGKPCGAALCPIGARAAPQQRTPAPRRHGADAPAREAPNPQSLKPHVGTLDLCDSGCPRLPSTQRCLRRRN